MQDIIHSPIFRTQLQEIPNFHIVIHKIQVSLLVRKWCQNLQNFVSFSFFMSFFHFYSLYIIIDYLQLCELLFVFFTKIAGVLFIQNFLLQLSTFSSYPLFPFGNTCFSTCLFLSYVLQFIGNCGTDILLKFVSIQSHVDL